MHKDPNPHLIKLPDSSMVVQCAVAFIYGGTPTGHQELLAISAS